MNVVEHSSKSDGIQAEIGRSSSPVKFFTLAGNRWGIPREDTWQAEVPVEVLTVLESGDFDKNRRSHSSLDYERLNVD